MYRQGDLLLQKIDKIPKGTNIVQDNIVLRGEFTGHAHRVQNGKLRKDKNGFMFIDAGKLTMLVHEEHNPIKLPQGKYVVVRQREYAGKDMVRIVID